MTFIKAKTLDPKSLLSFVQRHAFTLIPFLTIRRLINITAALLQMALRCEAPKSMPFIYRIDPCTACNIRCPNCEAHAQRTKEKRLMSLADFRSIIDSIRQHCIRASIYDTGEPLLNKEIYNMISYASDKNISTSISTNLNLFDVTRDLDRLFASRLTVIHPDLDGISQDTYQKYRVGGDIDIVKTGIEAIAKRKRETGEKYPFLEPQILRFKHLIHEREEIEAYLKGVGVDNYIWKEDSWGFNPVDSDSSANKRRPTRCFWLYIGMMIRPDGNVYPCCGRGFGRLPYGNILRQPVHEIWNNKLYRLSRQLFQKGPDIAWPANMPRIPCIDCELFEKQRGVIEEVPASRVVDERKIA